MSAIYEINRGINKPITFKGLRAQYIWWMAGAIGVLLILFSITYMAGVSLYVCIGVTGALGCGLFSQIYRLSHTYGEHGLMKSLAQRKVPSAICCNGRLIFLRLSNQPLHGFPDHSGDAANSGRNTAPAGHQAR